MFQVFRFKRWLLVTGYWLLTTTTCWNQTDSIQSEHEQINYTRLSLVSGALVGSMTAIHIYQQNGWWKDNRTSFHFQEDLSYSLGVDKIGHFHGASAMTYVISKSLQWSNVPEDKALWYGAGGSLLLQTFLEVEDGFSTWGFDRVDFAMDLAGAALPILQRHIPALNTFRLKFSYFPSDLLNRPGGTGFQGQQHLIMDDYEGQTFWLTAHFKTITPEPVKSIMPEFLCLAVGYGARDIVGTANEPYPVWFLALDIDMTKILPQDVPWMKTLGESLNYFHLPMPAIRISPSAIWYGLYF